MTNTLKKNDDFILRKIGKKRRLHGYFVAHSASINERPRFCTCYNKHALQAVSFEISIAQQYKSPSTYKVYCIVNAIFSLLLRSKT